MPETKPGRRWRKGLLKRGTWRAIGDFRRAVQEEEYDHIIDTQGLLKSVMLAVLFDAESVIAFEPLIV